MARIIRAMTLQVCKQSLSERQREAHLGADAFGAFDGERAAMQFHERTRQGEAEAGSLMRFGMLAFDLLERTADLGERAGRDTDAGIFHRKRDEAIRR